MPLIEPKIQVKGVIVEVKIEGICPHCGTRATYLYNYVPNKINGRCSNRECAKTFIVNLGAI